MARYGRGGKRWIQYDTAQNITMQYNMAPIRFAVFNSQQSKINAAFSLMLSHVFECRRHHRSSMAFKRRP